MAPPEVVLFGKSECGPCFEAEQAVRAVCSRLGVEWRFVNIDAEEAPAEYREGVPVLHVGGVEVARGRITEHRVEDAIAAAAG